MLIRELQRVGISRNRSVTILIAAILMFAGKVSIASRTFGSTDALLWEANVKQLQEAGPVTLYEQGTVLRNEGKPYHFEPFNHPPFMTRVLYLGGWLSEQTRLPFRFWLRFACAVADLVSAAMVLAIVAQTQRPISPVALFLVIASPISLLISGFHGNTDPIMMALLLLAVYLVQRGAAGQAGIALGLAAGVKIVPLLFTPALVLFLPARKRAVFVASVIGVFLAGSFPLITNHWGLIRSHVFGYSPQSGMWGISLLEIALDPRGSMRAHTALAKAALLMAVGILSLWLNLRRSPPIFLQCGLVAFTVLLLTPGFGVQYLAWLVPWTCLLNARQAIAFQTMGGLFLTCYYTLAAHGFPWNLANSAATPVWHGPLLFVGMLCWLVVGWLTVSLLRRAVEPL